LSQAELKQRPWRPSHTGNKIKPIKLPSLKAKNFKHDVPPRCSGENPESARLPEKILALRATCRTLNNARPAQFTGKNY